MKSYSKLEVTKKILIILLILSCLSGCPFIPIGDYWILVNFYFIRVKTCKDLDNVIFEFSEDINFETKYAKKFESLVILKMVSVLPPSRTFEEEVKWRKENVMWEIYTTKGPKKISELTYGIVPDEFKEEVPAKKLLLEEWYCVPMLGDRNALEFRIIKDENGRYIVEQKVLGAFGIALRKY